jgi:peptidoglycan hydrolase-like protein with peptidoglycan-binding domain
VYRARTRVVPCLAGAVVAVAVLVSAVPASAHTLGSRTLRQGASGADVLTLQADLSKAGFITRASGKYTAQTAADVKRFQHFYVIRPTGVADAHTVAVLTEVDKLDAETVDTQSSGGSGLSTKTPVKVKVRRSHAKKGVTTDPTKLLKSNPVLAPVKQNGQSKHLGNRVLRPGMHGHDVRVLQAYLTIDGYPTTVDGDYGPATKTSVVAWQGANNVADNAVFTYHDSRLLRDDVAKQESSSRAKSGKKLQTTPGATATIDSDGDARAPASAPQAVKTMIAAANSIDTTSYCYGGGHFSGFKDNCYDCSGATGYVLHAAGFLNSPEPSGAMEGMWEPGKGRWVTVYANAGHAFIVIAGLAFDTAHWGPTTPAGSGPRWLDKANALSNLNDGTGGYTERHPPGL